MHFHLGELCLTLMDIQNMLCGQVTHSESQICIFMTRVQWICLEEENSTTVAPPEALWKLGLILRCIQ